MMNGNPMFQMLQQMMMRGANPQMMVQNILQQNPRAQIILNQVQASGMSPKQFAEQYAKNNNIDLNQVVNQFKGMGIKF